MNQIILITGASSGFGRLSALTLAHAGHTVYAGMRSLDPHAPSHAADLAGYAARHHLALHPIQLDVTSQTSVDAAVERVIGEAGAIDVLVHNAGHMVFGPAEAFTPAQYAALYDVNVIGTQRLNRAALPHMRERGQGLLVWVSSSSVAGGIPPLLAPYFAAKAGMDALAVSYAYELTRWNIETTIVVPGAFTRGTQHFSNAGAAQDTARAAAYEPIGFGRYGERVQAALAATVPDDADAQTVADAIRAVVDQPYGRRPRRVHIDPANDGAEVSFGVIDRVRAQFLDRIGLADLHGPGRPR